MRNNLKLVYGRQVTTEQLLTEVFSADCEQTMVKVKCTFLLAFHHGIYKVHVEVALILIVELLQNRRSVWRWHLVRCLPANLLKRRNIHLMCM